MEGEEAPAPTAKNPMPIHEAARVIGDPMRDYLMARRHVEREETHKDYFGLKYAFRETYGVSGWKAWFEWIVDEWDLEDFIFDREALRDS
jgi:hypothetical protein